MAVLAGMVVSLGAIAQAGGGWGGRGGKGRMYDPKTVATVSGTVESVAKVQVGRGQGVHLTIKTAEITKGGQVLKLRDPATGVPLWSRCGGGSK